METLRQQMITLLNGAAMTALEISQVLRIPEKDVVRHLAHIEKSLAARGRRLAITPSICMGCGFRFVRRRRLTRPGRCPQCRQSRISEPLFRVAD